MRIASAAAVAALAAAPAFAGDVSAAFDDFSAFMAQTAGAPFDDTICDDRVCNGYVGNHQFQAMWPDGGWLSISYLPAGTTEERMGYCAALVAYATGFDAEAAGLLTGRLIGEAGSGGSARTDFDDIQITARSSGECEVKSPAAL